MCVERDLLGLSAGWACDIGKVELANKIIELSKAKGTSTSASLRSPEGIKAGLDTLHHVIIWFGQADDGKSPWATEEDLVIMTAADQIFSEIVAADTNQYKTIEAMMKVWVKATELQAGCGSLEEKGVNMVEICKHEQAEGSVAYILLRRGAVDNAVKEYKDKLETCNEYAGIVASMVAKVAQLQGEQNALINAYQTCLKSKFDEGITEALGRLQEVSGGIPEGKSWKDELSSSADFDTCVAHARSGLFRQRGIRASILQHMASLTEAFRVCNDFPSGKYVASIELHQEKDAALKRAYITLCEAAAMQLCVSVSGKCTKAVQTKLDTELATLSKNSISSSLLHVAILNKITEVSGAGSTK